MRVNIDKIFQSGVEAGRKQLMNHIQHQHKIGKPVEINGELYWLKNSREHLLEIIESMEKQHG